ncbi:MAG: hypothetical protein PQ975_00705 [Methanobacterium sp.]
MFQNKVYRNEVLNKMGHVFERFSFLMRTRSLNKEQVETIDYHLSEIMKVLNKCG